LTTRILDPFKHYIFTKFLQIFNMKIKKA
jgi:hypothetical protein